MNNRFTLEIEKYGTPRILNGGAHNDLISAVQEANSIFQNTHPDLNDFLIADVRIFDNQAGEYVTYNVTGEYDDNY